MLSEFEESSRRTGQYFRATFMDRNFVFHANSSHAFHVNSGFQSYDVAGPNYLFLASAQPRPFVNLYAHAVARAMDEIRSKTC